MRFKWHLWLVLSNHVKNQFVNLWTVAKLYKSMRFNNVSTEISRRVLDKKTFISCSFKIALMFQWNSPVECLDIWIQMKNSDIWISCFNRIAPQENEKLKETNIILESQNQDLSYQLEDWAVINKMDTSDKVSDGKIPHSQKNIRQFHVFLSKENYVPKKDTCLEGCFTLYKRKKLGCLDNWNGIHENGKCASVNSIRGWAATIS